MNSGLRNSSVRPRPPWSPKFRCPGRTTAHRLMAYDLVAEIQRNQRVGDFCPWFTGFRAFCDYIYCIYFCMFRYIFIYYTIYKYIYIYILYSHKYTYYIALHKNIHIYIVCIMYIHAHAYTSFPVLQDWISINSSMAFHGIWIFCSRNP